MAADSVIINNSSLFYGNATVTWQQIGFSVCELGLLFRWAHQELICSCHYKCIYSCTRATNMIACWIGLMLTVKQKFCTENVYNLQRKRFINFQTVWIWEKNVKLVKCVKWVGENIVMLMSVMINLHLCFWSERGFTRHWTQVIVFSPVRK